MNYVRHKKGMEENTYSIQNLKRKIEIAELAYRKAKKELGL